MLHNKKVMSHSSNNYKFSYIKGCRAYFINRSSYFNFKCYINKLKTMY